MRRISRKSGLSILLLIVTTGSVWLAAAIYGTAAVRNKHLLERKLNTPSGIIDMSYTHGAPPRPPWFYCRAYAVAPLIIKVEYARISGPLGHSGGTTYYLWCFGFSKIMADKTWDS